MDEQRAKPDAAGKEGANRGGLTDAQVATYLRRHPDFLIRHSQLLDCLDIPARDDPVSTAGGVVDLQRAMVARLRTQKQALAAERDALLLTSQSNASVQDKVHRAVLLLLSAGSFEQLIDQVTHELAALLDLDVVTLCVEQDDVRLPAREVGGVRRLSAGKISQALAKLSLSPATPPVLLALGARQIDHFEESQGTDLLRFLAESLERMLRSWLELPQS